MPASEFWLKTKPKSGLKPRLWRGSYIKSFSNLHPVFYLFLCYYQTFPTFSSCGKRWTGSVQPSVGMTRWQSANSKMSETPRWMIKHLKWYKRDIKINCREKFHTKGCYFFRTNSTIFNCDSLLKEMVHFFLRSWESERACRVWRGCWDAAWPGKWTDWCTQSPSLKGRSHHKVHLSWRIREKEFAKTQTVFSLKSLQINTLCRKKQPNVVFILSTLLPQTH